MIDEEVALATLKEAEAKAGVLLAEVRLEERDRRHMAVKEGEISSVISAHDRGMNVRVVMRSGTGFAGGNTVSKAEGLRLLQRAFRNAKDSRRRTEVSLSPEPSVKTSWEVHQKRPLIDVGSDEKLGYLKDLDRAVMKTKVKVRGRFYELKDYEIESFFANTEGSRIRSFLPRVVLESTNAVISKGESAQSLRSWGASGGWEKVEAWALDEVLPQEMRMLKAQLDKGRRVKAGTYDLVCGPEVAGIAAHESCGHPMEADRIIGREMSQAGRSFVSPDMIGKRIGSEYATVIDDPTLPGSYGYYAYDEEGVKARPRFLYKAGIINEFLHNRETASKLGVQSNGSSRSEFYLREPIVRMANTFVAPGDFEDDEIFGDVKDGVLMHSFTEWNIDDKRYNQKYVSREAYFIKDGEIAGPAKNCVLEITTPGFWGAIDAVSRKLDFVAAECGKGDPMQAMPVFTGGPMLRLRSVALR
ncbi:MAG: TldD/PmbA family protein [Candidatus Thermoplasmatota archaeon]|nr:TldD/PmbA family protein [Candidatus Thermoplasmatota archaeon]